MYLTEYQVWMLLLRKFKHAAKTNSKYIEPIGECKTDEGICDGLESLYYLGDKNGINRNMEMVLKARLEKHKPVDYLGGYWWKSNAKGHQKRVEVLIKLCKETKPCKSTAKTS